jgi:antitoxin MazE
MYLQFRNIGGSIMQAIIKKRGNSPALRLSTSVMELAQLALDQSVNINVLKGKIIIEPILPKYTPLDGLLAGITSDNIHAEESFGGRVGKEIL